ncbi:hypothetical protein MMC25_002986 [Agyrium rufum]|nr:hypothetical protein [Agyrium rufum]
MALYLVPPNSQPASIAPSLTRIERGVGTLTNKNSTQTNGDTNSKIPNGISKSSSEARVKNPTVVPLEMLQKFQFTFLIRHPRSSIPSYYRCCIPPLNGKTGFTHFMPSEAGYDEMRKMFDYLRAVGEIGPVVAGQNGKEVNGSSQAPTTSGHTGNESSSKNVDICVVDADDLLDNPAGIIEAYCQAIGYEYDPAMLNWDSKKDHGQAEEAFAKWNGFHEDAIHSSELKPRQHRKAVKTEDEENEEWAEKYGADAAKIIRETVDTNVKDYEYLKQFALKV